MAELIISLLILSVLSVVMVGVIPSTIIGTRSAANRARAAVLARDTIESLQRNGYDNLADRPEEVVRVEDIDYTGSVTLADAVAADGTVMDPAVARQAVVLITWKDRGGEHSYEARTVLVRL